MWRVCADPAASVGQVLTGGDTGMLPRCGDAAAAPAVSHKGCGAGDTEAATARGMSYKGRGVGASAAAPAARADRKRLVARLGVLGHAVNLAAPAARAEQHTRADASGSTAHRWKSFEPFVNSYTLRHSRSRQGPTQH